MCGCLDYKHFFPAAIDSQLIGGDDAPVIKSDLSPTTVAALVGSSIIWGLSFVVTKIALKSFDQYTLVFLRFGSTAIFFFVLFSIRGFPKLKLKTHGNLLIIALFQPVLYFLAETAGLERTTAAKASLIIATIPGIVLLSSRFLLSEQAGTRRIVGAVVSIVGVALLVLGDPAVRLSGLTGAIGDLFIVGAVFSAVCYMLLTRSLANIVPAIEITGFQFMYGAILFLPIYLLNMNEQIWSDVSTTGIFAIAYLIIFASIGGFLCYNFALTKTQASTAAVYLNGIPIVATIAGWTLLGERMVAVQGFGAVIVFAGIYAVSRKERPA